MGVVSRLVKGIGAYLLAQQVIGWGMLASRRVERTLTAQYPPRFPGKTLEQITDYEDYTVTHVIEDGIERISYRPRQPRFTTPIVMQHGMWHGAWCWERWQRLLALQGWETHAHSLPGHALSPTQRPISLCTLDYYLSFLKREVERHPVRPVLMGHSMGGALTQWYLKYVGDDLPAAVLVGPWGARSNFDYIDRLQFDWLGMVIMPMFTRSAWGWVRNPAAAARVLISSRADITPEALHAQLNDESVLVVLQHMPPFWSPPANVHTPLLLVAGGQDTVCPEPHMRASAERYRADYYLVPDSAHNLMMDVDYERTALYIHDWLAARLAARVS